MSSGLRGAAGRVSIPSGVRKTIENIKEITGQNHSEDEIYAMLKECSMDPNETAQKLLLLDTFHEVKSKRDRRKENKESAEMKWKPGIQPRANRGGRGNYSSRYISHDVSGGRNSAAMKENAGVLNEKGSSMAPLATSQDVRKKENSSVASPIIAVSNGPTGNTSKNSNVIHDNHASGEGVVSQSEATAILSKLDGSVPLSTPIDSIENPNTPDKKDSQSNNAASIPSAPASGSYFSTKDPIESKAPVETASEVGIPNLQQNVPYDFQGVGKTQHLEAMQNASSTVGVSTVSRPSSNYNNRSQVIGPQKVGPGKEWKPKSVNPNNGQDASAAASSDVSVVSAGSHPESQTTPVVLTLKDSTRELQRSLEASHISDSKHVIIPNHLHVPKVEKLGFCFGSFDASFGLNMDQNSALVHDKSPPLSESSEAIEESVKELQLSNQSALVASDDIETKHPDQPQSPSPEQEKDSSDEVELSSSITPDYSESKPEAVPESHQHPVVHGSSNYNFGFMTPILSGQLTPLESSESQARDAPRLPGFVVPQTFDPASYYAQFYRPGSDDGRISPFHSGGAANKYNGNAMVSTQTSQIPQEGGVPLVLTTASPAPLVTQAAGVMQSSIPATQQPLPVFRQPTGVHLPHYPPNYLQYGPYFSPFYVPPPAIHQFLSNGAYPQQPPQSVNLYPTAPGTTAKYSASQFKQGSNTGSSPHVGVPGSYAPYGLPMANYTSTSVTSAVNAASNEDVGAPQVKEKNIYVSGQQVNSFYNLPQGQLAFAPTQPGHGAFTGVFHPAQAVTAANVHPLLQQSQAMNNPVDMVGPTANVYQQPQHAQLNWPSNY